MSLDLVAVQRDAALLDALSQRQRLDDIHANHGGDPVVGLLAALVADVDDGLPAVDASPYVPEQSRRQPRRAAALTLAAPVVPLVRRRAARAIAALAVATAVLSVGGVAAAVSGDPLTPYKSVINVVRDGYHNVTSNHGLTAPEPKVKAAAHKAKLATATAERTAKAARQEISTRASRNAWRTGDGRRFWARGHRQVWDRHGRNRYRSDRSSSDRRFADRSSSHRERRQWGGSAQQAGWGDGAGQGGGGTGSDSSDSSGRGDGAGDARR
jgi:hypothetical protein